MDSYRPGSGEHYRVDTPERVDLDYDVASIGSRLIAAIVDTLLITLLYALLFFLGAFALESAGRFVAGVLRAAGAPIDPAFLVFFAFALILLFSFGVFWGYYLFFELVWHGQSPGKRWMGLRVIREGGYPIGFSESAIRNLIRVADFLPLYYGIGALVMFIDRRSRRLGDLAAGTLVVKERRDLRLDSLTVGRSPDRDLTSLPIPNLHVLTATDQGLLREYLLRRPSLAEAAAARLAAQLADGFARKLEHDLAGEQPEAFLLRLARDLDIQ